MRDKRILLWIDGTMRMCSTDDVVAIVKKLPRDKYVLTTVGKSARICQTR